MKHLASIYALCLRRRMLSNTTGQQPQQPASTMATSLAMSTEAEHAASKLEAKKPWGQKQRRDEDISRALSRLLRHQALNAGIELDEQGYAPLGRVLQWPRLRTLGVTARDVFRVTADNEKQRYSIKPAAAATNTTAAAADPDPSHWLIRANQGHSIKLASSGLLTPITLEAGNVPAVVVHGTYFATWPAIVASGGLSRMGRTHVHCCAGLPGADGVVSGMRSNTEMLVYVDVRRSLEDGALAWWLSENGVVLTEGLGDAGLVPATYFARVVGWSEDVGTLWEHGRWVADLPDHVATRPPRPRPGRARRAGARTGGKQA